MKAGRSGFARVFEEAIEAADAVLTAGAMGATVGALVVSSMEPSRRLAIGEIVEKTGAACGPTVGGRSRGCELKAGPGATGAGKGAATFALLFSALLPTGPDKLDSNGWVTVVVVVVVVVVGAAPDTGTTSAGASVVLMISRLCCGGAKLAGGPIVGLRSA